LVEDAMSNRSWTLVVTTAAVLMAGQPQAAAADSPVGTWAKASDHANTKGEITMAIERWGRGAPSSSTG